MRMHGGRIDTLSTLDRLHFYLFLSTKHGSKHTARISRGTEYTYRSILPAEDR